MRLTTSGFQTALEDFLGSDCGHEVLAYSRSHRAEEQLVGYPSLLTVEEASQALGMTSNEVRRRTGDDALPAIEIGSSIRRYRREDVHNYLRILSEYSVGALEWKT